MYLIIECPEHPVRLPCPQKFLELLQAPAASREGLEEEFESALFVS